MPAAENTHATWCLQVELIDGLKNAGQYQLAFEYCNDLQLNPYYDFSLYDNLVEEQLDRERDTYLQLPDFADIIWVKNRPQLFAAAARLAEASIVGLDIEHQPCLNGQQVMPSLLQVTLACANLRALALFPCS